MAETLKLVKNKSSSINGESGVRTTSLLKSFELSSVFCLEKNIPIDYGPIPSCELSKLQRKFGELEHKLLKMTKTMWVTKLDYYRKMNCFYYSIELSMYIIQIWSQLFLL